MEVDVPATPVVTISTYPGLDLAAGQTETFSATVVNGGPLPSYQWLLNGVVMPGETASTYVNSNLVNGDSVTCQVLSSGGCPGLLGHKSVTIHVYGTGVQQITAGGGDIKLVPNPNKGIFTVKGTLGTTDDEEVSLEVTDMLGQVIYRSNVLARNGSINESVDLGHGLANGMYMLNLRSGSDNKVFHLVIEQ